jgi:hypothetical protein
MLDVYVIVDGTASMAAESAAVRSNLSLALNQLTCPPVTDGDTFADTYASVRMGTPLCWKLVAKENSSIPATSATQVFRATVDLSGGVVTSLDTRDVLFLVRPLPLDEPATGP